MKDLERYSFWRFQLQNVLAGIAVVLLVWSIVSPSPWDWLLWVVAFFLGFGSFKIFG
jgi:hypothetical protein